MPMTCENANQSSAGNGNQGREGLINSRRGTMLRTLICLAAFAISGYAAAKAPPQPAEPIVHPDWKQAGEVGINLLKSSLFDPSSAQIRFVSGFRWGFIKPIIGRRTFGWVACGNLNAKNRLGGYVSEEGFALFVAEGGGIQVAMKGQVVSTCDDYQHIPVNEELLAAARGQDPAPPVASVADELKKLADLRAAGILTEVEFTAQKAKLLGH